MPKISVLVAVYNTAEYLPHCLDSLLNQTLKDVEVVCVDDASTDDSLDILHQYAARDTRLRVIALDENRGQAHARNIGLSCATGDYIGFVDSDDWLGPDALERVCEAFCQTEVDCVLFRLFCVYADGHQEEYSMPHFTVVTLCAVHSTKRIPTMSRKGYTVMTTLRESIITIHVRWPFATAFIIIGSRLCRSRIRQVSTASISFWPTRVCGVSSSI